MRKKIEYRSSDEENGIKDNRLWIEISGIKSNETLKDMIDEVLSLGFEVRYIEDGSMTAFKPANSPLDIIDPKYESYRALARICDE